ncbi:hypothetical protein NM688_g2912 [Phlebia brevispora]|uniref:Uncharacterized protein n=1 Tax=Phlebia brevispora TaxID=194682 RepID=A0ACC1T7G5_9APHY|nr:hypothetical protein NM688_g2912 [Phlebia brevispora]
MERERDRLLAPSHNLYTDKANSPAPLRGHAKRLLLRHLVAGLSISIISAATVLFLTHKTVLGPTGGSIKYIVPFGDSYTDIFNTGDGGTAWPVYAASYGSFELHSFALSGASCDIRLTPRVQYGFPYLIQDELPDYFRAVEKGLSLPPEETMYSLWIGTNDIGFDTMLTGHATPGTTIVEVTRCAVDWIRPLYESGVRNFLFQNLIPLNLTIMYSAEGYLTQFWTLPHNQTDWNIYITQVVAGSNEIAQLMLKDLPRSLPGAHIGLFDSHALFQDIYGHPAKYLNGTAPLNVTGCIKSCPALANGTSLPCTIVKGSDKDSYLWYDEIHPSEQANRVVAREFTDAVLLVIPSLHIRSALSGYHACVSALVLVDGVHVELAASPNDGELEPVKSQSEYRLPTDVKPTLYEVTVRTDLEKLKFDGFVVVHLDVVKDTSTIVFNSSKLSLGSARLTSSSLKQEIVQTTKDFAIDEKSERCTISLPTTLSAGSQAQLKIDFDGELTGSMMGYYRSAWEHEGKTKYYTLTQFEPTAARRAFPCWDEPLLKARFSVTMISRADTVNLNNMPAISEEVYTPGYKGVKDVVSWLSDKFSTLTTGETDKWKITHFETTPPMSTYLVAFANGPFTHIEDTYKSPLSGKVRPLRVYTTPDLIHQARFALDVKKSVLPLYEQVFDIEFPLPKLDTLVANDFDAGAMENWGLITGRTNAFLIPAEKADLLAKKQVAIVQSHEVAHMWFVDYSMWIQQVFRFRDRFGDITTMAWWDNLYLNEGFASLMGEVIILDKVFPEWKVQSSFIADALASALSSDAKLSSHPIEVECPDANMINQIFDALSYSKAASVLRMLSVYVGEDKFLKGVSIYLKRHLYSNSVTKDLWEGIQEASGIDVPKMMDNWVKKMGFPVVTVKETKDGIVIRQDRFLETGPAEPKDNETIWTIPLSLITVDSSGKVVIDRTLVLDEREKTIPLDTSKPFKLNAGTTGVYRVLYTPDRLTRIAQEAVKENSVFSVEDRIGLVYDALALAKAGYLDVSGILSLYDILRNEKEYLVWRSIADALASIESTWYEHEDISEKLNAFRRELFAPLITRLGFEYPEGESVDTAQLRTKIIEQAANAGDETVVKKLCSWFKQAAETGDDSHIPPDLIRITFFIASIAVHHGGRAEFDHVRKTISTAKNPSIKISAMRAMGAPKDLSLAEETWNYILNKSRDQDIFYYFGGLAANHKTRHFLLEHFKKSYEQLYERLADNFGIQHLINISHMRLSSSKDLQESKEFFKTKDVSKYKMALEQAWDGVKARAAWIEHSTSDLRSWLEKRQK